MLALSKVGLVLACSQYWLVRPPLVVWASLFCLAPERAADGMAADPGIIARPQCNTHASSYEQTHTHTHTGTEQNQITGDRSVLLTFTHIHARTHMHTSVRFGVELRVRSLKVVNRIGLDWIGLDLIGVCDLIGLCSSRGPPPQQL